MYKVLQHFLAGDGEASTLGRRAVRLALYGLGVRVPEDGGQDTGSQGGEVWGQIIRLETDI